mmetsp:Transcript_22640/g.41992  ORF Transcript_22640/g.41992 Transcript_22640/m.41992 type:complete len:91 (-) Transcript_22640:6-278(-)
MSEIACGDIHPSIFGSGVTINWKIVRWITGKSTLQTTVPPLSSAEKQKTEASWQIILGGLQSKIDRFQGAGREIASKYEFVDLMASEGDW